MPIYQPSELRLFLSQLGITPRKGLSQNFLIDGNIVRKILDAAHVTQDDVVLEIGPGPGCLTEALLERGASVYAVEKDDVLARELPRLSTDKDRLHTFCEDILDFELEKHLSFLLSENKKAKVVANLPYHLTTPILTRLVPLKEMFSSLTIMVQEEVARRMTAAPNTPDYGSLTVFLRFYTQPHYDFTVSHHCFYPAPKIDSAVVTLTLREPPLEEEKIPSFFVMTRMAFEQRRKMLRTSLKALYSSEKVEGALKELGLNPLARPENLSLEDFLNLYAILNSPIQDC